GIRGQSADVVLDGFVSLCVDGSKVQTAGESLKELLGGLGDVNDLRAVEFYFLLRSFRDVDLDWTAADSFTAVKGPVVDRAVLCPYEEQLLAFEVSDLRPVDGKGLDDVRQA